MRFPQLALLWWLGLLPACGGSPEPDLPPREPLPESCVAAWQPVSDKVPWDIASGLLYRDGVLYWSTYAPELRAWPVPGGPAQVIAPAFSRDLWLEGDQLLFAGGDLGNQFFRVPVAGGQPELFLDASVGRSPIGIAQVGSHLHSATDLFWAESDRMDRRAPSRLWRAPRGGGPATEMARFDRGMLEEPPYFRAAALTSDAILLGSEGGFAWSVPLDDSPAQALARPEAPTATSGPGLLGVSPAGVYWQVETRAAPRETIVVVSPADGGPAAPFWSPAPVQSGVAAVWPDGEGGLLVSGYQSFEGDEQARTVIWAIDGTGARRTRLACSPDSHLRAYVLEAPAVAPDAIYFIARAEATMQIIRVPRV